MVAPTPAPGIQTVDLDSGRLCAVVRGSLGGCPSPSETSFSSMQVGAYVFIGVGAFTMVMGFLGCIGAVNEVRCLLGLVSQGPELCWPRSLGGEFFLRWCGADTLGL